MQFDNEKRNRYYGIRVGDEVEDRFNERITTAGTVVEYSMDNNCVYVKNEDGVVVSCVAEWLTITKEVE